MTLAGSRALAGDRGTRGAGGEAFGSGHLQGCLGSGEAPPLLRPPGGLRALWPPREGEAPRQGRGGGGEVVMAAAGGGGGAGGGGEFFFSVSASSCCRVRTAGYAQTGLGSAPGRPGGQESRGWPGPWQPFLVAGGRGKRPQSGADQGHLAAFVSAGPVQPRTRLGGAGSDLGLRRVG